MAPSAPRVFPNKLPTSRLLARKVKSVAAVRTMATPAVKFSTTRMKSRKSSRFPSDLRTFTQNPGELSTPLVLTGALYPPTSPRQPQFSSRDVTAMAEAGNSIERAGRVRRTCSAPASRHVTASGRGRRGRRHFRAHGGQSAACDRVLFPPSGFRRFSSLSFFPAPRHFRPGRNAIARVGATEAPIQYSGFVRRRRRNSGRRVPGRAGPGRGGFGPGPEALSGAWPGFIACPAWRGWAWLGLAGRGRTPA